MTILDESGVPDVLSPLYSLNGLAEKLPDVLLILVGTCAEAYLAQTLPGVISADLSLNPRFSVLVLDPEEDVQQGQVASRIIEAAAGFPEVAAVLLVAGRSAELLGVDANFEVQVVERRLGLPVRAVDYDPAGNKVLSTDLEDGVLSALVDICPDTSPRMLELPPPAKGRSGLIGNLLGRGRSESREVRRRQVVILGASSPPGAWRELAAELDQIGIEVVGNIPGTGASGLPAVGESMVAAVADPYLVASSRAATERGARVLRTLMPIGVNGTARFLQDIAIAFGLKANQLNRARSVWENLEPLRNRIRGKRIFFAGDTGLELPLARFLVDAGAVVLEVGVPRLDRSFLAAEVQALGTDVDVVESPDPRGQMERIDRSQPDIVVASPGLYVPLVARGHLCRLALDFLEAGIHGYEGARRILELFVRTFERAEALDSVKL